MTVLAAPMLDLDSHEQVPHTLWVETFGPAAQDLIDACANVMDRWATFKSDVVADDVAINEESVWQIRGPKAPSAIDLSRRPEVLDVMGVAKQLVFPTFGLFGMNFMYNGMAHEWFGFDPSQVDKRAVGRAAIDASNEWAIDVVRKVGDRLRMVAILPTESPEQMVADAERLIAEGMRVLWIPCGSAPAQTSPADPVLDPFWKLCADSNVAVVCHLGTEFGFVDPAWHKNVEVFRFGANSDIEFPIEPYSSSLMHMAPEAMLGAMVLGGVFERHPNLRFGVVECGAQWVGPLGEKLDLWAREFETRLKGVLSMKPSEYLARNLRVTPFPFEDIDYYIERYPHLLSVYSYGSDYPHPEGGRDSAQVLSAKLDRLGDEVKKAFFVTNGELLIPA